MSQELINNHNFASEFTNWTANASKFNSTKLSSGIIQRTDSTGDEIIKSSFAKLKRDTEYVISVSPEQSNENNQIKVRFKRKGGTKNTKVLWIYFECDDPTDCRSLPVGETETAAEQKISGYIRFKTLNDFWGDVDAVEIKFSNKWVKLSKFSLKEYTPIQVVDPAECLRLYGAASAEYMGTPSPSINGNYELVQGSDPSYPYVWQHTEFSWYKIEYRDGKWIVFVGSNYLSNQSGNFHYNNFGLKINETSDPTYPYDVNTRSVTIQGPYSTSYNGAIQAENCTQDEPTEPTQSETSNMHGPGGDDNVATSTGTEIIAGPDYTCSANSIYVCNHPSHTFEGPHFNGEYRKQSYTHNERSVYILEPVIGDKVAIAYMFHPIVIVEYEENLSKSNTESYGELENHEGYWVFVDPGILHDRTAAEMYGKATTPGGTCPFEKSYRINNSTHHGMEITTNNCIIPPTIEITEFTSESSTPEYTDFTIKVSAYGENVDSFVFELPDYSNFEGNLGGSGNYYGPFISQYPTNTLNISIENSTVGSEPQTYTLNIYPSNSQNGNAVGQADIFMDNVFTTSLTNIEMPTPTLSQTPDLWPYECDAKEVIVKNSSDYWSNGTYRSPSTYDNGYGLTPRRYWVNNGKIKNDSKRFIYWWYSASMQDHARWVISKTLGGEPVNATSWTNVMDSRYYDNCPASDDVEWETETINGPHPTRSYSSDDEADNDTWETSINVSPKPLPPLAHEFVANGNFMEVGSSTIVNNWFKTDGGFLPKDADTINLNKFTNLKTIAPTNENFEMMGKFKNNFPKLLAGGKYIVNVTTSKNKSIPVSFLRKDGTKPAPVKWIEVDGVALNEDFKSGAARMSNYGVFEVANDDWARPDHIKIKLPKTSNGISEVSVMDYHLNKIAYDDFTNTRTETGVSTETAIEDLYYTEVAGGGFSPGNKTDVKVHGALFNQYSAQNAVLQCSNLCSDIMGFKKIITKLERNTKYIIRLNNLKTKKIFLAFARHSGNTDFSIDNEKTVPVIWNKVDGMETNQKKQKMRIESYTEFTTLDDNNWNIPKAIVFYMPLGAKIGGFDIIKYSDTLER